MAGLDCVVSDHCMWMTPVNEQYSMKIAYDNCVCRPEISQNVRKLDQKPPRTILIKYANFFGAETKRTVSLLSSS